MLVWMRNSPHTSYSWPQVVTLTVGVLCKDETVTSRLPAPVHVFLICCHAFPVKNSLS